MPGPEKPLLHIAIEFVEMLDNALAEHQMLNVAHGELPAEAACIIDVPIEAVALPDPSHPQYGSALVKRLEIQTKNQSNRARRLTIVFNSRTKLFGMLVRSAKPKIRASHRKCRSNAQSMTALVRPPTVVGTGTDLRDTK